jgi:parallel beta-helix repeat protein
MERLVSCALALVLAGHVSAALPEGWSNRDIGTTGGSANEIQGTWTVRGDGADVWGYSDAFHFVYRALSGNGEITARVVSPGAGSDSWSKGGVMIRETLAPDSKFAIMAITGGAGAGLAFQNRPTTGGRCYSAHGNPTATAPYWVKLTRQGNTVTAYSSANSIDWVPQPAGVETDATPNPIDLPMATDVFVGLFVTSHVAGEVRTYTFDQVTVGRPVTAAALAPKDGVIHPNAWAQLSWTPGATADSHDVYFGESFAAVREGTGGAFQGNQRSTQFTVGLSGAPCPEGLTPGTTYYWRIDEVEADGMTTHPGPVWRFLVASERACNPVPPDGAKLVSTPVTLTWMPGSGAKLHAVHFGADFNAVTNAKGGRPVADTDYLSGTLEPNTTYYWRVDEFDGQTMHQGDVWSFTTRPAELSSTPIYYVDGAHPDASDTNPGTEVQPWKTIRRGTQSLLPGDMLLLKAGTYREAVILARSGTQANPIRIWAYPGQEGKVIINAAEPVTRWRLCTGPEECAGNPLWPHIYYADVAPLVDSHEDKAFAVRQVFQHGQLLPRSRFPDAGWHYPTGVPDPRTTFRDGSLSQPDGYFNGAVCHLKTSACQIDQIEIAAYSRAMVTLAYSPRYNISTDYGYYLTNVVGEINAEGEWAYDPARKRLFLWPKEDAPRDIEITYRRFCLRTYSGTSFNEVRGLTLHNPWEFGIWLYQAHHMTIENNTVEHSFDCGIFVQATDGTCADNCVRNNTVRYSCSTGIALDRTARNNRIEGNTVYATGTELFGGDLMHGRGEGIYVSGPFTRVYNNRVDRTGLTGVYLYEEACGREISYNHISSVALALSDTGGVYMGSFHSGPEEDRIHHNIIEDAFGCQTMDKRYDTGAPPTIETYSSEVYGIYVDEGGNHRILEYNTVIRSHTAGIYFHWAPGNVARHNTLYDNGSTQILLEGRNEGVRHLTDNDLSDNVMFATSAAQKTFCLGINYADVHFGRSDNNWFYHPCADRHIRVDWYGPDRREDLTLDGWRALSGYDGNSKDFAYLDQFPDLVMDHEKRSRIIHNPSLDVIGVDLGTEKYCDAQGRKIYGKVYLQPFESKVLLRADYETLEPLQAGGLQVH